MTKRANDWVYKGNQNVKVYRHRHWNYRSLVNKQHYSNGLQEINKEM